MPTKPVISIVDDDETVREGTMDLVTAMGFVAVAFPGAADFLDSSELRSTRCLIADVQMPGMTGFELYERLAESGNAMPTILITAFANDRDRARALRSGVVCYLAKPVNHDELLACIGSALGPGKGRNENTGENHG